MPLSKRDILIMLSDRKLSRFMERHMISIYSRRLSSEIESSLRKRLYIMRLAIGVFN